VNTLKALLVLAIALLHQGMAPAEEASPSLTPEQVTQILELVLKKGLGELAGFQPCYNAESKSWSYIHSATGGVHSGTFVEVRDADGSYRLWGYGSRRVPEFRMSPSLRRKIRAITRPRVTRPRK